MSTAKRLKLAKEHKGNNAVGVPEFKSKNEVDPTLDREERLVYEFKQVEDRVHRALAIVRAASDGDLGGNYESMDKAVALAMQLGGLMGWAIMEYREAACRIAKYEILKPPKAQMIDSIVMSSKLVIEQLAAVGFILEGTRTRILTSYQTPRLYPQEPLKLRTNNEHENNNETQDAPAPTGAPEGMGNKTQDGSVEDQAPQSEDVPGAGSQADSDTAAVLP